MSAPIVMLHGFAGHADGWDELRAALPGRRTEAITLFGHDGTRPDRPVAFMDEVERVVSFLRAIGEPVRLCGYSMGGRVALGVLARAPEVVASAVLIGANPGVKSEERAERAVADEAWARLIEEKGVEAFIEEWQAQPLFASQAALDAARLERQRKIRARHDHVGLALAMRCLGLAAMPSFWGELERIFVPVDLVVGGLDTKFTALAERIRDNLREGSLHIVDGAGHNVVLERPAALAAIVDR